MPELSQWLDGTCIELILHAGSLRFCESHSTISYFIIVCNIL